MRPRRLRRAVIVVLVAALGAVAIAQPDPSPPAPTDPDPWGPSGSGSPIAPGSGTAPGSGGTTPGSGGTTPGSGIDPFDPPTNPGTGSGTPTNPGSGGSGAPTDPGTGSAGSGTNPGTGSGSTGSGSGSAAGSGSGSATGPVIIQVPTDLNAPTVSAAAAPTEVRLGGKFTVFITATFNVGVEVNLREPLDLGPAFEVTRRLSEDRKTGDGRTTREWQLEVIAWELGDLKVPPIAVTYTFAGKADQVATNMMSLRVIGVLGDVVDDPKAMRGDAPPTDLLSRDWFWLYVAIGAAVGLGLLFTLISVLRSRRHRVNLVGGVVAVPRKFDSASDRALHELKEIEDAGVLDRDEDRKKGYAQMVEVIREYIGSRYRVATLDLTTSELMAKLAKLAGEGELALIEGWLERCDIVKYGGLKATAEVAKQTLEDARALVVTTTQMPVVPKPTPVAPVANPASPANAANADAASPANPAISVNPANPASPVVKPTANPANPVNPKEEPVVGAGEPTQASAPEPERSPWAPAKPPERPSGSDEATTPFHKEELP